MIIAIDFDGTCVTHEYPKVGRDIGAVPVLKALVESGHQLILWTMRCDKTPKEPSFPGEKVKPEKYLQDAVNWFKQNDIPLFGIQCNPEQHTWTESPKAYAQLYIDDAALGCPLVHSLTERPYVNWSTVEALLKGSGIIKEFEEAE